ncbi:MAG: NapC/NirT family cytochrome c [Deferrisomatales bacterium]|nr:NapC/NirT family cytochrome c [Deferrisomatales bacterium]
MLRDMWEALTNFLRDFFGAMARGSRQHWKGMVIFGVVAFFGLIALMVVVLEATASPKFCAMCHNMQTYIESWEQSSHKQVNCIECHFKPGTLNLLKGKWQAQTHVVYKITGKEPSRSHTQISDESCLREGCHSLSDLGATDVTFKGVSFNHRSHTGELRAGKRLRCVSCHSQIVQGEHLTVTERTCFVCHFFEREKYPEMAQCRTCHVQTKAKIFIDANENLPFVHKEYLDRGVQCGQCHFDVVTGDGHLKDNICVQCHAEPDLLLGSYSSKLIHDKHITEHKVDCFRCHAEIDHGIVRPQDAHLNITPAKTRMGSSGLAGFHYDTNCVKCHSFDQHESIRMMYMGTGAVDVPDMPSPMYAAHADCGSCHIYLTTTQTGTKAIMRMDYERVIQSCADCHGSGYDDMAKHWKQLLNKELDLAEKATIGARQAVSKSRGSDASVTAAAVLDVAEKNLTFARVGRGLHNMDYALRVLADVRKKAEKAKSLVVSGYAIQDVLSPTGCTQLCHSCVECIETTPVPFGNVQFPHDVHVKDEGLACEECHSPREQHGQTFLKNCNDCHHGSGMGAVECEDCHVENHNLYNGQNACDEESCDVRGDPNVMVDAVTCDECHIQIADGKQSTLGGIKDTCVECHDDDPAYAKMVDEWIEDAAALGVAELTVRLKETQGMVLRAIKNGQYTYDAQDLVNNAEKNLKLIQIGNPLHNIPFSRDLAARVSRLLDQARKDLQTYSTIKTLPAAAYK